MESRDLNIQFNKSKSGSFTPRVSIPTTWVKELDIAPEDKEVMVTLLEDTIVIRKNSQDIAEIENNIEERLKNMSFSKGGSGSITARIILPISYTQQLNLDADNKEITATIEDNIITIQKRK